MNIDELTLGQMKEIAKMLPGIMGQEIADREHPFLGKYVLCRCYSAGVHTGELVSVNGDAVILRNSRRLWSWKCKNGIALSGVAQFGLASGCKVDVVNPQIYLTGVIEIIPMTEDAHESVIAY